MIKLIIIFFKDFFQADIQKMEKVSKLFGFNYCLGLLFIILMIASLFIFKKNILNWSKTSIFNYTLASFVAFFYVSFYLVHYFNDPEYKSWLDFLPLQICSILSLSIIYLLIRPNSKMFGYFFPMNSLAFIAILLPSEEKQYYGLQHFLYYNFYFVHGLIIFSFLYLYFSGLVQYQAKYLFKSIGLFFGVTLLMAGFNEIFDTNFLFIGKKGFGVINLLGVRIAINEWWMIFRIAFMVSLAIFFVLCYQIPFIALAKPFSENASSEVDYNNGKTKLIRENQHETMRKKIKNCSFFVKNKIK